VGLGHPVVIVGAAQDPHRLVDLTPVVRRGRGQAHVGVADDVDEPAHELARAGEGVARLALSQLGGDGALARQPPESTTRHRGDDRRGSQLERPRRRAPGREAQQRPALAAAELRGGDEQQRFDALGLAPRQAERGPAPHRVADRRESLDAEGVDQLDELRAKVVRRDRSAVAVSLRVATPESVVGDPAHAGRERTQEEAPRRRRARHPVQEDDGPRRIVAHLKHARRRAGQLDATLPNRSHQR